MYPEGDPHFLFDQYANDTQRMPAQDKRIFISCRNLADAEHTNQRFQLIRQRHNAMPVKLRGSSSPANAACNHLQLHSCHIADQPVVFA